jgi:DNA replication protein DnaC
VPLAETASKLIFQLIADRATKAAVIVTTNLPFSEWSQVIIASTSASSKLPVCSTARAY